MSDQEEENQFLEQNYHQEENDQYPPQDHGFQDEENAISPYRGSSGGGVKRSEMESPEDMND